MSTVTRTIPAPTGAVPAIAPADFAQGVIPRFATVLRAVPDALAVIDAERTVTFRRLAAEAAAVRDAVLSATGSGPAQPIGVLVGHHAGAVAAVLGVLASGHPLLMLDTRTPVPRLRALAERVGARFAVCDAAHAAAATEFGARPVLLPALPDEAATGPLPEGSPVVDPFGDAHPDPQADAVLSFTSGSTGVPKVVRTAHRQLVSDAWANSLGGDCYDDTDVVGHTLPMAFHAGLMVTIAGPLVGAPLALYDIRGRGVAGLPDFVAERGVSVMHASPAILRALVEAEPAPERLAGVRSFSMAGEMAFGSDVTTARTVLPPHCSIFYRYGSSETGLISQLVIGPQDPAPEGPLPVGAPIGATRIRLLDDRGDDVPPGEVGTVTVVRADLADGYLGDEERTAEAFGLEPDGLRSFRSSDVGRFDDEGRLVLLGRRDHSVKIRGYLVEPGEIDAVLFAMPEVREAVVVGAPDPADGQMRLIAYVVIGTGTLNAAMVRTALREQLPAHMVPQRVVFLDALPRTERGKLDRAALPEPTGVRPGTLPVEECSDWQLVVAEVFTGALGLDDIGLDDDFFELGGDSLAAEAVMARMIGELGVDHPDATSSLLVQAPTVRQFAERLTRTPEPGADVLVPVQPNGDRPPLFMVAGGGGLGIAFTQMARRLHADQPFWAFQSHGLERRALPDWSVGRHARRNVREIRRVQPHGPYHLAGHSFGGLVAYEMAQQLRAAGEEIALLIELDAFPPDPTLHVVLEDTRGRKEKLRDLVGLALTGLRGDQHEQFWRFYRMSQQLHRWYRGRPYPGRTLVVLAQSPEIELRRGWGRFLTGEWSTVEVSGDHNSMLREPHVAETAAAIQAALDALE